MKPSNPFVCQFPFTYVSKANPSGYCTPCCRYELDEEDYGDKDLKANVEKAFTSKTFEKIRNKMLKGEKIAGCRKCYDEEENGKKSYGRAYTEHNSHFSSGNLRGMNIALSRDCNLACRMCHPNYSTKWDPIWSRMSTLR